MLVHHSYCVVSVIISKRVFYASEELQTSFVTAPSKPAPLCVGESFSASYFIGQAVTGFITLKNLTSAPFLHRQHPNEQTRNLVWDLIRVASGRVNCMVPFTHCPACYPRATPESYLPRPQYSAVLVATTKTFYSCNSPKEFNFET
jgi:hypothetical protein